MNLIAIHSNLYLLSQDD